MDQAYAPWVALACGIVGMLIGYFFGFRTGRIAGELAALKSKLSRRDRSRSGSRHSGSLDRVHDVERVEDFELASRSPDS